MTYSQPQVKYLKNTYDPILRKHLVTYLEVGMVRFVVKGQNTNG